MKRCWDCTDYHDNSGDLCNDCSAKYETCPECHEYYRDGDPHPCQEESE